MGSPPQGHRHSPETLSRPFIHPTRYTNTTTTLQDHQNTKISDSLERLRCYRSTFLAASEDIVPHRLPDALCYRPIDSPKSTPEEANCFELGSLVSTLTLNSKAFSSLDSQPTMNDSPTNSLVAFDDTILCRSSASSSRPSQLSDSNRPKGTSNAENYTQASITIEVKSGTRSTARATRKRNISGQNQEQEEEDDASGDDGDHGSHHPAKTTPPAKRAIPMACPYRKRNHKMFNYRSHPKCTEPLLTLTRVKQHLKGQHMLPESEWQRHGRQTFEDGITQYIERRLAERGPERINTWKKLWILLFGDDTDIPTSDHEPCNIFEQSEVAVLMKEAVNEKSHHQALELENSCPGARTQETDDDRIDRLISTHLASRDEEDRAMPSAKRKSSRKQTSKAPNIAGGTNTPPESAGHHNHALRMLAPKPSQPLPRPSEQEPGSSSRGMAPNIALFDPTMHGNPSDAIASPARSLRRSARLTPHFAQTPPSAYPPVPSPEPWISGGHHDQQQFEGYQYTWAPTADDIAEDLNEDEDNRV